MDKYTCLTCLTNLSSAESQREHYKKEWHIYNLKRKLNQLKPLTEVDFNKIKEKHSEGNNKNEENSEEFYCDFCGKNFFNKKSFEQHISSKKHVKQSLVQVKLEKKIQSQKKEMQQKPVIVPETLDNFIDENDEAFNESDWEEVSSDEENLESIPIEECLFCETVSKNMETNLSHMLQAHSFFVPDVEYCVDLKGLLNYLGIKIASGRCCLWCSEHGKQFASKKAAQQHMIDKGHTKMKLDNAAESLLEFEDFYDYSTSYPDDQSEVADLSILDDEDYQLHLPSGAVIGHRSLLIFYKQKLNTRKNYDISRTKNQELLGKVVSQYKSLGWTGLNDQKAVQRAKDIHYMNKIYRKFQLKLGLKHNHTKQCHFRSQIGF